MVKFYKLFVILCLITNLHLSSQSRVIEDDSSQVEKSDIKSDYVDTQNLKMIKLGGRLGIISQSINYEKYSAANSSSSSDIIGVTNDLIPEYSGYLEYKLNRTWSLGIEVGYSTDSRKIVDEISLLTSGLMFSGYAKFNNMRLGVSILSPNVETATARFGDNISTDVPYKSFSKDLQNSLQSRSQTVYSAYFGYEYYTKLINYLPLGLYGKVAFDLTDAYGKENEGYTINSFRMQFTFGTAIYFNIHTFDK